MPLLATATLNHGLFLLKSKKRKKGLPFRLLIKQSIIKNDSNDMTAGAWQKRKKKNMKINILKNKERAPGADLHI